MDHIKRRSFLKRTGLMAAALALPGNKVFAAKKQLKSNESKVPKFTFATTLKEQEKQLKTNPLMLRFAEERRSMASDPHRPFYHFVNPKHHLNDPNGLCYWNGKWHLFFQAYPPEDRRQHWGHAISDDLIHWRDLPYAIYPNPERACFSGSTYVEKDRVIAMYHGTTVGNMVAVSSDPLLLNWEKVTGKAVIPLNLDESVSPYRTFDPCIWKKGNMYYSLSGGTLPNGPGGRRVRANFLWKSKDLAKWEYMHPFVENDMYSRVGDDGACPYFWPIGDDKHIMLHYSHTSGGKFFIGDYDKKRDKFVVTNGGNFNFGPSAPCGVHAPSACPDGKGSVIAIFNMNPGKPTKDWTQIMTLPRRLSLPPEGSFDPLLIEPAGDIESLRYEHKRVGATELPANKEVVLKNINGNAMEMIAVIDVKNSPMVELNVLRSANAEEVTKIRFYETRGYKHREYGRTDPRGKKLNSFISIDSAYSSVAGDVKSRAPEIAEVFLDKNELLELRVFLDRSVVEVFVNGRQCVAQRVYPDRKDSVGVSLRSQGQNATLKSLDAWQMKSIYEGV